MNARNQTDFTATAAEFCKGNPMRLGTPHTTVNAACNAIRDMWVPGHHDLSQVIAVLASKVKDNGALGESVKRSVVEMLDELVDEIDQDLVNQQAEADWLTR